MLLENQKILLLLSTSLGVVTAQHCSTLNYIDFYFVINTSPSTLHDTNKRKLSMKVIDSHPG